MPVKYSLVCKYLDLLYYPSVCLNRHSVRAGYRPVPPPPEGKRNPLDLRTEINVRWLSDKNVLDKEKLCIKWLYFKDFVNEIDVMSRIRG